MRTAWPPGAMVLLLTGALGCGPGPSRGTQGVAEGASVAEQRFDPLVPPTQRQVVRALLSIRDSTLAPIPSCATAGTSAEDRDIGDYVSGWLSELGSDSTRNWVEVTAAPDTSAAGDARAWRSAVTFRHAAGDDEWGWGVRFLMRGTDHRVVPGSIDCIGAG